MVLVPDFRKFVSVRLSLYVSKPHFNKSKNTATKDSIIFFLNMEKWGQMRKVQLQSASRISDLPRRGFKKINSIILFCCFFFLFHQDYQFSNALAVPLYLSSEKGMKRTLQKTTNEYFMFSSCQSQTYLVSKAQLQTYFNLEKKEVESVPIRKSDLYPDFLAFTGFG